MPKIGPWRRKKPLISWENLGVDALNKYCKSYKRRNEQGARDGSVGNEEAGFLSTAERFSSTSA